MIDRVLQKLSHLKYDIYAVLCLFGLTLVFFREEVFEGKVMYQSDMFGFYAVSSKIMKWHETTGKPVYWHYNMFCGMPSYVTFTGEKKSLTGLIHEATGFFLPLSASTFFRYLFCTYLALRFSGIQVIISVLCSIIFAFFSHNVIILTAGHITKAWSVAFLPLLFSGLYLFLHRKKIIGGGFLLIVSFILIAASGHVQIFYYAIMASGIVWLTYFIWNIVRRESLRSCFLFIPVIVIGVLIAFLANARHYYYLHEYTPYTIRGEPVLEEEKKAGRSGLDFDYLTAWSADPQDIFTLMFPDFRGGESTPIGEYKPEVLEDVSPQFRQYVGGASSYFGSQPFTSGPFFVGISPVFLFVLFLLFDGFSVISVSFIVLFVFCYLVALGRNFPPLIEVLINYFPYFSKFRVPSMIMVIILPVFVFSLAFLSEKYLKNTTWTNPAHRKSFIYGSVFLFGISIICYLFISQINGDMIRDEEKMFVMNLSHEQQSIGNAFLNELRKAREIIVIRSVIKSVPWFALVIVLVFLLMKNILPHRFVFAVLLVPCIENFAFSYRYIKESRFIDLQQTFNRVLGPSPEEYSKILKDTSYFRVWDATENPTSAFRSPYLYNSTGGYSAAKLRKYQHLIEKYISKGHKNILNMLNVKYIIKRSENGFNVFQNYENYGPAWLVDSIIPVSSPDEELSMLDSANTKKYATISTTDFNKLKNPTIRKNPGDTIYLLKWAPDKIEYKASIHENGFAVFSEIYYKPLWKCLLNGKEHPVFNVDYVLRGIELPPGEHTIAFICEQPLSTPLYWVENIIIFLLIGVSLYPVLWKKYGT